MEEDSIAIIECYTAGDEVGLEGQSEHRILAERPCLPKRKHSIITLQTTTILRIPSSGSPSKLSGILPVGKPLHEESAKNHDEKSVATCDETCTSQPFEVRGSGL